MSVRGDGKMVADDEETGGVLQDSRVARVPPGQIGARLRTPRQVGGGGISGDGHGEKTVRASHSR